eukprot:COSAG03_NODE_11832_length_574_cov_1.082105_1_plen_97_part_01
MFFQLRVPAVVLLVVAVVDTHTAGDRRIWHHGIAGTSRVDVPGQLRCIVPPPAWSAPTLERADRYKGRARAADVVLCSKVLSACRVSVGSKVEAGMT